MGRLVEGLWDCPYCGTKGIGGLTQTCPNCGKTRGEETKFYMGSRKRFGKSLNNHSPGLLEQIYIDIRFPREKMITYARPYICISDETGEVTIGWTSIYTSEIFGNVENSCQFWDEFVVGFIRADEEYQEADAELFNKFKEIIEAQYE